MEASSSSSAHRLPDGQQFRLQKIGELEVFLRSEVKRRLHKKYRRAVNAFDSTSAALGLICVITGSVRAGLLAFGIGFALGLVLEVVTGFAGLLHVVGVAANRRCSTKAAKHEAVRVLAVSKLNTFHSHISKALEDYSITDNEYKLILEECEKYRSMKEELRHKHGPATSSVIDEETKAAPHAVRQSCENPGRLLQYNVVLLGFCALRKSVKFLKWLLCLQQNYSFCLWLVILGL